MGRKSTSRPRIEDPIRKIRWITQLMPVFQQRGLKKFNMSEVAAELGISKATLYKYFQSREVLLLEMLDWKISEISGFRSELMNSTAPFTHRFVNAIKLTSGQLSEISTLFLSDVKKLHPNVWQLIVQFMEQSVADLQLFYQEGIDKGAFQPIHPVILAATDQLFFSHLADPEFLSKHNLKMEEAVEAYFTMKFGGILKRPITDEKEFARLMQGIS